MHPSSYNRMAEFAKRLKPGDKVLDVGSMDVNGTFRDLFDGIEYTGLDIEPGPNVDVVEKEGFDWPWELQQTMDAVISGSTFAHARCPWALMENIEMALKPGGLACIIAPSQGPIHNPPIDCWRILPDGMRALGEWAGLAVVGVGLDDSMDAESKAWRDCWGIFRKPGT